MWDIEILENELLMTRAERSICVGYVFIASFFFLKKKLYAPHGAPHLHQFVGASRCRRQRAQPTVSNNVLFVFRLFAAGICGRDDGTMHMCMTQPAHTHQNLLSVNCSTHLVGRTCLRDDCLVEDNVLFYLACTYPCTPGLPVGMAASHIAEGHMHDSHMYQSSTIVMRVNTGGRVNHHNSHADL